MLGDKKYKIQPVKFQSADGFCAADFYRPGAEKFGVIIMAHGFAAERSWKLPEYAAHFAANGIGVLLFDYRNFGDSPGEPRQLISPARHLQDYESALSFIQGHSQVDSNRIGVWGASFSAGHSVYLAAKNPKIAAISLLVPFLDFWPVLQKIPPLAVAGLLPFAVADWFLSLVNLALPLQIVGDPGEAAMLTFPGWKKGILDGVPADSKWINAAPARVALELPFFRPAQVADSLKMPVLVQYGSRDTGIPAEAVKDFCSKLNNVELQEFRMGHIDPFQNKWFPKIADAQLQFFQKHLHRDQ
ncbi:MAG: alpha/beta fold hydrolase [Leptospiraceae bacterium]|nr:alpha/beta fold hydrolase [Leptospiraceae bacterium]